MKRELLLNVCGELGRRQPKPEPLSPSAREFYEIMEQDRRSYASPYRQGLAAMNPANQDRGGWPAGGFLAATRLGAFDGGLCSLLGI